MATPLVNTLSDELDRIAANYEAQFAGQTRATRNLDELDAIIDRTRELVARIDSVPQGARPRELQKLRETAATNLDLYKRERELIVQAKSAPAELDDFSPHAAAANFVFAKYGRHFAGQGRATRDLGLLGEMVSDLERIRDGMRAIVVKTNDASFKKDLDIVTGNLDMYQREKGEIDKARKEGNDEERASLFAELANNQFKLYQVHFAGRSRTTRRPALLVRMLEQLKEIQKGMRALKSKGLSSEPNDRNIGIVQSQLEMFDRELAEVRKVRKDTKLDDLMGMLGSSANDEFNEYRTDFDGKNRATRNLEKLSDLCDRLGEIRRQMDELSRTGPNEMNDRNLEIVTAQLSGFEQEWDQIKLAQEKS